MDYINEFRDAKLANSLLAVLSDQLQPNRYYRLMEFCGGHTHTIQRYGLPQLLPKQIELIHGPGCPVCVLPVTQINKALQLAVNPHVILCCYGDLLRIPGMNQRNLLQAKAEGADVRVVYSVDDALQIAENHREKEIVFFAIGFETTTPPTAVAIKQAKRLALTNFSVFCNHVLTPVAMASLLETQREECKLDGIIGPAHVSIITGAKAFKSISSRYKKPVVIAGFEPLDILHAILMLARQIEEGRYDVEVQYTRAVTHEGSRLSQNLIEEVLELRDHFEWRGLGRIPRSAWKIKEEFADFDAEIRFSLTDVVGKEHKHCECGSVLRGLKQPKECKLFATGCTPQNPLGACMVSSEGACAAVYAYGR